MTKKKSHYPDSQTANEHLALIKAALEDTLNSQEIQTWLRQVLGTSTTEQAQHPLAKRGQRQEDNGK